MVAAFDALPLGGGMPDVSILHRIASLAIVIWELAFELAAPISIAIFVQNMATGVLARAMPQMNLLLVNLPLHVGMLLFMVGFGAPEFVHAFKDVIEVWPSQVFEIVLEGGNGSR